jgi:hypothetical protein
MSGRRKKRQPSHARGSPNHETLWPCRGCGLIDGRKGRSGVECGSCGDWWHSSCAGLNISSRPRRVQWSCPRCSDPSHVTTTARPSSPFSPAIGSAVGAALHQFRDDWLPAPDQLPPLTSAPPPMAALPQQRTAPPLRCSRKAQS